MHWLAHSPSLTLIIIHTEVIMVKGTVDSVTVRMYRHGFGDCFLLQFWHKDDRVQSILIDCGIKLNTKSDDVPIEAVIDDLKSSLAVDGHKKPVIDVLVATHEHWDHVAFFHPTTTPDFFNAFEIKQLWLAWTENPDDKEAKTINSRLRKNVTALSVAASRLQAAEKNEVAQFQGMRVQNSVAKARSEFNFAMGNVLGFYGLGVTKQTKSGIKYKTNSKISAETELAIQNLIKLGQRGSIQYLEPGTTVDSRRVADGVRAYVLGPPKSSLINKSNPSGGQNHETYFGIDAGLAGFVDGLLELGAANGSRSDTQTIDGPFKSDAGIDVKAAKNHPFFQTTYFDRKEKYRRIENSWLDAAGQFALQLDGAINNTSLVLAFELESTGKILLFPGDAQVGSWLSWHEYEWKIKRDGKTEAVTAEDLLKNTVLYKVSHHGSHNATVRDKGLELMTHPELVAMIAEKERSYEGILYQPLMKRLNQLCKGRVIVSADSKHKPEDLIKKRPSLISATEWKEFKENLTVEKLYVEYLVR
jgi:hypothetical protein